MEAERKLLEYKPDYYFPKTNMQERVEVIEFWRKGIDGRVYLYRKTVDGFNILETPYKNLPFRIMKCEDMSTNKHGNRA